MVTETEVRTVHFTIQGDWFTDFLRGLWAEGSEVYAVKTWIATFPEHANVESLKNYFIKVVSGKAKFEGDSDGDGFDLVEDDTKSIHRIPLLDSWEDVILLKKLKLLVREIELRKFRLHRRYPDMFANNALDWANAVDENRVENSIRKEVNKYLTDIHNFSVLFDEHSQLIMLPEDEIPLLTGPTYSTSRGTYEQKIRDWSTYIKCKKAYAAAMEIISPIDHYFKNKYGDDIYTINTDHLKFLCGIDPDREEMDDKALERSLSDYDLRTMTKTRVDMSSIVPQINVEDYVKNMVREGMREDIKSEDPSKTEWKSGYIDRKGKFYGCSDLGHVIFSEKLCEKFNLIDSEDDESDPQQILDNAGWVKVSMNRFLWDCNNKLTQSQQDTIFDYMQGKGITKALFNTVVGNPQTLAEAIDLWS